MPALPARDLAMIAAIGLALVVAAAAISDALGAHRLSESVADGQTSLVRGALVRELTGGSAPDRTALEDALERHDALGLRWLATLSPDGEVLLQVGEQAPPGPLPPPGAQRTDGTRMVGRIGPEVPHPVVSAPAGGGPGAPPDGPAPPGGRPRNPATTVLAFAVEPMFADELQARARREVALAFGVALSLVAGAAALRRALVRGEELEGRLAGERRLAALGEMSAVLAHELRNPLASLKGNAQLLVEVLADQPKLVRRASWLVEESTRMQRLTTDLLDFARSGGVVPERASPAQVLTDAAREACPDAVLDTAGAPEAWSLDPVRVHQALSNLLRNAAQACADPPPEASVRREGDDLVFVVRDHGPGLPDDVSAEALFEPFRTTRTRGTGLGLAVVARVASLHGGRAAATNRPEGGAEFRLELPRAGR